MRRSLDKHATKFSNLRKVLEVKSVDKPQPSLISFAEVAVRSTKHYLKYSILTSYTKVTQADHWTDAVKEAAEIIAESESNGERRLGPNDISSYAKFSKFIDMREEINTSFGSLDKWLLAES